MHSPKKLHVGPGFVVVFFTILMMGKTHSYVRADSSTDVRHLLDAKRSMDVEVHADKLFELGQREEALILLENAIHKPMDSVHDPKWIKLKREKLVRKIRAMAEVFVKGSSLRTFQEIMSDLDMGRSNEEMGTTYVKRILALMKEEPGNAQVEYLFAKQLAKAGDWLGASTVIHKISLRISGAFQSEYEWIATVIHCMRGEDIDVLNVNKGHEDPVKIALRAIAMARTHGCVKSLQRSGSYKYIRNVLFASGTSALSPSVNTALNTTLNTSVNSWKKDPLVLLARLSLEFNQDRKKLERNQRQIDGLFQQIEEARIAIDGRWSNFPFLSSTMIEIIRPAEWHNELKMFYRETFRERQYKESRVSDLLKDLTK